MPVHFLHISKTGGSAMKDAIRSIGEPETSYGKLHLHPHPFTLEEVPEDHHVFFCVRDPMTRFVSSFYSRMRKSRPRYFHDWNDAEREAFEIFDTPRALAAALESSNEDLRARAEAAMGGIQQVRRHLTKWLRDPILLKRRRSQIVYIARQETLDEDWEQLKDVLGLPQDLILPSDPKSAHRGPSDEDRRLDETAKRALSNWYAQDYLVLGFCEQLRRKRGWGSPVGDVPPALSQVKPQAELAFRRLKRRVRRVMGA
jgi:Sulfotransferase family